MAVRLLGHEISELCLGRPALRSLSVTATVGDALSALKRTGESCLSVWDCDHYPFKSQGKDLRDCVCIGKVCMVDIICFLAEEKNLASPFLALESPVSVVIPKSSTIVRHLEPHSTLLEAIDLILEGAQNIIVPIQSRNSRRKFHPRPSFSSTQHNGREYCWLTQEDVIRYLLNSIGIFSPVHASSIATLNIINSDSILAVRYEDPAKSALPLICQSHVAQTSVAILDENNKLVGEISPYTLACCDETVAAAVATLSAGDLMAYIDCGGPPEDLVKSVKTKLKKMKLEEFLELMEDDYSSSSSLVSGVSVSSSSSSCSSDEEFGNGKSGRIGGYSARMVRRSEAIVCYPWSSLVAVIIQALAHRVSYVWVVEEDGSLLGVVTFPGILKVFRESYRAQVEQS